jgi:hypothetical protein
MLLRSTGADAVPLPPEARSACDEMLRCLPLQPGTDRSRKAVHSLLRSVWTRRWLPEEDNHFPCPTERALILISLRPDGGHANPEAMTGPIAHLQHCIRLLMVVEILDGSTDGDEGDHLMACLRLRPWFTEGETQSTFHKLRTLTHRATAIAKQTMSNPSIFWTDRVSYSEMLYQGHRVRFRDICNAVHDLHAEAVRVWEEEVLMGLPLRVDCRRIADNLPNCQVGYSCFRDPRNACFAECRSRLWEAMLTKDELRERFLRVGVNGCAVWNRSSLFRWLQSYGKFSGLQMAAAEMTAGSAIRATELHSMNVCNTKCRTSRNALAMGDHLVLMVRYTKTGGLQKHDRFIPHALDAITADLMIQDHAIAWPFAEQVIRTLFPGDADKASMYRSSLFVNGLRTFSTDDLTDILGDFTEPHVGLRIGVRSWRQISTGFKRKRCPSAMELYNGFAEDTETVGSLQLGHGGEVDRLHYAVSTDALASTPPEEALPLFVDASVDWQVDLGVVPGECTSQTLHRPLAPFDFDLTTCHLSPFPPQEVSGYITKTQRWSTFRSWSPQAVSSPKLARRQE